MSILKSHSRWTRTETEEMIALSERTGRKVTVGHDLQFSPVARRMRQFVQDGYLGGAPVHTWKAITVTI